MNRLNYKHLYYFWRIATTGNLTAAAEQLHVSQSALSMQLKQLEHQLNVQLFTREARSLTLTREGAKILEYAEEIFSAGEALEQFISSGFDADRIHLNIGVLTNLSRNFIEKFVGPLLAQDKITFTLHTQSMEQLLENLANHELDLALTNLLPPQLPGKTKWQSQLVSRQQLAIIGPKDCEAQAQSFPNGFTTYRWILPKQGTEIRNIFDTLCSSLQFKPNILAEADDMAMLRLLTRDSGALSVLPPVVVQDEIANHHLKVIQPLAHAYEHFYAITLQHKRQNPGVRTLFNLSP